MKKFTLRGKLIKTIIFDFMKNCAFENSEILNELQRELNRHLKFETRISNIECTNDSISGLIYFKSNEFENMITNFVISKTATA